MLLFAFKEVFHERPKLCALIISLKIIIFKIKTFVGGFLIFNIQYVNKQLTWERFMRKI